MPAIKPYGASSTAQGAAWSVSNRSVRRDMGVQTVRVGEGQWPPRYARRRSSRSARLCHGRLSRVPRARRSSGPLKRQYRAALGEAFGMRLARANDSGAIPRGQRRPQSAHGEGRLGALAEQGGAANRCIAVDSKMGSSWRKCRGIHRPVLNGAHRWRENSAPRLNRRPPVRARRQQSGRCGRRTTGKQDSSGRPGVRRGPSGGRSPVEFAVTRKRRDENGERGQVPVAAIALRAAAAHHHRS